MLFTLMAILIMLSSHFLYPGNKFTWKLSFSLQSKVLNTPDPIVLIEKNTLRIAVDPKALSTPVKLSPREIVMNCLDGSIIQAMQ